MNLQTFIQNTPGKAVTYDGLQENFGQCEQLVCLYWKEVYGFITPSIQYAKDLITNPTVLASFDVIPVGQEQAGDVAVFGASTVINSPEAGHTDIVITPQTDGFLGWDSNWGGVTDKNQGTPGYGYPAAHEVQHSFQDVIGFLRFKEIDMKPQRNQILLAYQLAFGPNNPQGTPTEAQIEAQLGQPDLSHVLSSLQADSAKAWAAQGGTVNKQTVINYINSNLN